MTRRERRLVLGVGGALGAAAVVVLVLALISGGTPMRGGRGCIAVRLAYATGGEAGIRCGAAARALCAGVGRAGGVTGAPARGMAAECRRAGLRVG